MRAAWHLEGNQAVFIGTPASISFVLKMLHSSL